MEACGVLVGTFNKKIRIIEKIFRTKNILNVSNRYEIDPTELMLIFQKVDKLSLAVIGFYHSHPFGEAKPSEIDKSLAFYNNLSYAIYSVMMGTMSSYIWNGRMFLKESVKII